MVTDIMGGDMADRCFWKGDSAFVQEFGLCQCLIEFFDYAMELPVTAIVNREVIAVHDGISDLTDEKNITSFFVGDKRDAEYELWSDLSVDSVPVSGCFNTERGKGILYGMDTLRRFLAVASVRAV